MNDCPNCAAAWPSHSFPCPVTDERDPLPERTWQPTSSPMQRAAEVEGSWICARCGKAPQQHAAGQPSERCLYDPCWYADEQAKRAGVVVAALVARAEFAEAALRRVEALIQTFDIAQPRIAEDLRAALDNGR